MAETELGKVEEMRSEKWFVVLHYKDFGFFMLSELGNHWRIFSQEVT